MSMFQAAQLFQGRFSSAVSFFLTSPGLDFPGNLVGCLDLQILQCVGPWNMLKALCPVLGVLGCAFPLFPPSSTLKGMKLPTLDPTRQVWTVWTLSTSVTFQPERPICPAASARPFWRILAKP